MTAGNDSQLFQNPSKLPNVSKDRDATSFPLAEPCLSMYSADHATNDKHRLSDNRIKEKVCLSSPDTKSADVSSIPGSIALSLDSKGTVLNSKEFSQNEVTKDSPAVCDSTDLSRVIRIDSGQRIENSSKCNLRQVLDSNFPSAVEGQEIVVAHREFTTEDLPQTAVVKHFAQMPTGSLLLSTEHNCLKSVNSLDASSVKELNSIASLVEGANTFERNLLLTNSDSNDKAGNNKNVTFSQQTAVGLKFNASEYALNSRCKADDSIAQETSLYTEPAKEKASDKRCMLSSGSVNSGLVKFNDKAASVADEKAVQREIQKSTSRKNNAEDVQLVHKSNETLLQTSTEKRRNLDLNLEKNCDQSNELKMSAVDLRLKIQSKTCRHSSRNSLHSECSSIESTKDKRKGFKDKTGDAYLGRDDKSRRGRNDESSRKRSSAGSNAGDRICELKTSKPHRSSEKDLSSHKRKSSSGEKDDKEPRTKKGKYEGRTIQEKLLRMAVLETAASHCRQDLPATSADCKHSDELQRRSSSQSALVVLPERSVVETDKHYSPNTPEIEQMQRYIQLGHRHDTAQKIIQKEAAKHVNKIIEEKKLAAAKRREVDAMFDSSTASSQDDDKIGKKSKRLDSDVVKPSPTLFSRRAEAKLKQVSPATTAKVEQSLEKPNDINRENRDLIFDKTAVNFQMECLKNVSFESLELSKILETVSTKSVLESSCGKETSKESSCKVVSSGQSLTHVIGTDPSVAEAGTVSSNHAAEYLTLSELVHSIPRPVHPHADSNKPLDQNLVALQPSCETSKMNVESDSLCCGTPLHPGAEIQTPRHEQEANQNDNHSKIVNLLCRNSPGSPPDMLFDVALAGKTPRTEHDCSTDEVSKLMNESFDSDFYVDLESVQLEDLGVDGISTEYLGSVHVTEGKCNDIEHFFDPFTELENANCAEKSSCVLSSNKGLDSMANNAARPDHLILSAESDRTQVMVTNEAVNGEEIGLVSFVSRRESNLENGGCKIQEGPSLLLNHKSILAPTVGSLEAENDALSAGSHDDLCNVSFSEPELLQVHAPEESLDFLQSGIADQLFGNLSFSSSSESEKPSKGEDREIKVVDTKEIVRGCMGDDELEEGELEDSLQNTLGPSQELRDSHSRNEKRCSSKWKKKRSWSHTNLLNGKRKVEQQNDSRHHQTASEKIRPSRSRSPESTLSSKSKTRHSDDELRRHNRDNKHQTHSRGRQQYRCSSDNKGHASRSLNRTNNKF